MQGDRRGEKQRRRSVLLLHPLTATEWWQTGVDHRCRFSLSRTLALSHARSVLHALSLSFTLLLSRILPCTHML